MLNKLKRVCLILASSSVINWILFIILLLSLIFGFFNETVYKIAATWFALEVMFLNANRN